MRMRKRHNLAPRMEACGELLVSQPEAHRGRWREDYPGASRIFAELGCGKGRFTVEMARRMPDALFLAVERVPDAMVLAMERAKALGLSNVLFMDLDAARLTEVFAPGEIDGLFLNFSDPWPKSRDAKFRLTAPGFLRLYADVLPLGGEIRFKTDNTPLFDWSLEQLRAEGWELSEVTHDLHRDGPQGVMTDYEIKFVAEGLRINSLLATKTESTKTTAAGAVPRLRCAALADARGNLRGRGAPLCLEEESREQCQAFFRQLQQAPELFEHPEDLRPCVYAPEKVDALYERRRNTEGRRDYSILLDGAVIGELAFKRMHDHSGELEICLARDEMKNRQYGSRAIRLGLERAFSELGLDRVTAAVLERNTRSQRVLQKNGFRLADNSDGWLHFELTREQFARFGYEEQT